MTSKKISRFSGEGGELSVEKIKEQGRTGEVNLKDFGAQDGMGAQNGMAVTHASYLNPVLCFSFKVILGSKVINK